MGKARLQVAQAFVGGANLRESFGMMLGRKLFHQFEVTAANCIVVAVVRQPQDGEWVVHELAPSASAGPKWLEGIIERVVVFRIVKLTEKLTK